MNTSSTTRACESCRFLKVKCRPPAIDNAVVGGPSPCQRCLESGRDCAYTERRRTKRKRTDVRVRELEQQVADLTQRIGTEKNTGDLETPTSVSAQGNVPRLRHPAVDQAVPPHSEFSSATPNDNSLSVETRKAYDAVASGLISLDYADQLFRRYVVDVAPLRPLVVLPPSTTAEDMRHSKPILFLAILAAAAGTVGGNLSAKLSNMVDSFLAEHVMVRGEKSLELIQAILVTLTWLYIPDDYSLLKFNQLSNMAAAMAFEIGLDTQCGTQPRGLEPEDTLVKYRTLLGCYVSSSSISLKYHRPNVIPFTADMAGYLQALEEASGATPTDRTLAAWVRLQHTIDLSAAALGLRSRTVKADLTEEKAWLDLQSCARQLISWRRNLPSDIVNGPLLIQYHAMFSFIHEIGLYSQYKPDDFRPPYTISSPDAVIQNGTPSNLSPAHLSAILACVSSAHSLIHTFLAMSAETLRCCPVSVHARMGYTVVVLVKISVSSIQPSGILNGRLQPEATNMERCFHQIVQKLTDPSLLQCRKAQKWVAIVRKIEGWYTRFMAVQSGETPPSPALDLIEPLKHLNIRVEGHIDESESFSAQDFEGGQSHRKTREDPPPEFDFPIFPSAAGSLPALLPNETDIWLFGEEEDEMGQNSIMAGHPGAEWPAF